MNRRVSSVPLASTSNITTGKLDSNHSDLDGIYPFFTCAPNPLRIHTYAFDDSVILIAGNNAQGNFHINRFKGKFNAYQRTYVLTAKQGYSLDYLYYSLKLELNRLKEKSQGSQTKFLTRPILESILINDIGYSEQESIALILTSIEEKIELSKKIKTKLETMSKQFYDYWFVQFDFPDRNGKPYKSSGGKMVWNEELKKEIPEGWETYKIGDLLQTSLGGTPSTKKNEYWNDGKYNWLNSGEIANFPIVDSELKITEAAIKNSATELLPKGTVLLSITRHLRPSILGIDACANQSVVGIKEKGDIKSYFLYPYLQNEIPRLMSMRSGAQQPHINKEVVDESIILLPNSSSSLLRSYNEKVCHFYDLIFSNAFEKQKLDKLRDWLLPMLMNGQVKVKA